MHVKIFTDRGPQNTSKKEFWTKHLSFVMNLGVKYSPVNTAADQGAIVGANTFLLTAKSKCQILSVLPEILFRNCFPFWQYRFCSAVWQKLSGFAQWKKLLPNHFSKNLWSYSATELFCQVQTEQFLPSFPSLISHSLRLS